MSGKVYLVGAGPGDPGLITMKGLKALWEADVVLYDRLVPKSLLRLCRKGAKRIYVGKEADDGGHGQGRINQLLIAEARKGKAVVRLKGGDPFLLARGGEEAEALAEGGVRFEVIPGVTSALAVPAYAGIPVTDRRYSPSVIVATGHEDPSKGSPSLDWTLLGKGRSTLVFLMGVRALDSIARRLIEAGRPGDTPSAVIENGTTRAQRAVLGTLNDIAEKAQKSNVRPPAVLVVGDVVKLAEKLKWYRGGKFVT